MYSLGKNVRSPTYAEVLDVYLSLQLLEDCHDPNDVEEAQLVYLTIWRIFWNLMYEKLYKSI